MEHCHATPSRGFLHPVRKAARVLLPIVMLSHPAPADAEPAVCNPAGHTRSALPLQPYQVPRTRIETYVSEQYRISRRLTAEILVSVCEASRRHRLDPFLVLAIVSVESGFDPAARGHGDSRGLMQVVAAAHPEKLHRFGGIDALHEVKPNLMVGTWVLRECIERDKEIPAALQRYNGARFDARRAYSRKVLAEQRVLESIASGTLTHPDAPLLASAPATAS